MPADSRSWYRRMLPSERMRRVMFVVAIVLGLSVGGIAPVIAGLSSTASAADSTGSTTQASFSVRITTTNSPVVENETLDVFATVENTGNESGTQTVRLSTDGEVRERENVTLQPGESTTVKLSWETTGGDAGSYLAIVESEDGATDSTPVSVHPPEGVPVESCTTIDEPGLYVLNDSIDNSGVNTCIRIAASNVALRGQGFTVNGVDRDRDSVGIKVDTSTARRNVTVKNLTVTRWDTGIQFGTNDSNSIRRGAVRKVNASRNRGTGIAVSGGTNNQFRNNTLRNNTDALVLTGSSDNTFRNTTFRNNSRWAVSAVPSDAAGSSTNNTFASPDLGFANASLSFALRDAKVKAVEAAAPSPPPGKTDIGVYLDATDTGVTGTLDLTVKYRDSAVSGIDESTLALWRHDGNWTAVGGTLDAGANTLRTEVTEFSVFAPLADAPSPNFEVSIDGTNSPVTEGELLEVAATVRNTGERTGTQTVHLRTQDGTSRDNATVELAPGESRTLTLAWPTTTGDAGSYVATVASANDSTSTNVTVEEENEPPEAAIRYSPTEPTVGETVLIAATNSADSDGRIESYEWQIDGEVVSTAESFEHTFESGGTYQVRLAVTDDDGATTTTTVSVSVSTPTPTPTPTATPTPPGGETVPGFGGLVALVALLAAGLLAARRRA